MILNDIKKKLADWIEPAEHIAPLAACLPYLGFDADNLLTMQGSTGFLLTFSPSSGMSQSHIDAMLQLLLNDLPDHSCLHVCLWGSPYLSDYMDHWSAQGQGASDILREQIAERRAHFLAASETSWPGQRGLLREFRGYIGVAVPSGRTVPEGLLAVRDKFLRECQNMGLQTQIMLPSQFLFWTRAWLNMPPPSESVDQAWYEMTPLAKQIVSPTTHWQQMGNSLYNKQNDWRITPLMATGYPEHFSANAWVDLMGSAFNDWQQMNTPFAYHLMAKKGAQKTDKAHAQQRFKLSEKNMRYTWLTKLNPNIRHGFNDWKYTNDSIQSGNDGLLKIMVSATVFAKTGDHDQAVAQLNALGVGRRFKWQVDPEFSLPLYLMQCPLYGANGLMDTWDRRGRLRTMPTSSVVHLMPLLAYQSTPPEGLLLNGAAGELIGFDNFSAQHQNYNLAVTGPSGAGKSVFIQELIARNLTLPHRRVFVLDIGKSYEASCHVLGGQYIDFAKDGNLSMNPFTLISQQDWIESKQQIIFMLMVMIGIKNPMSDQATYSAVADSLEACWAAYADPVTGENDLTFTRIMQHWEEDPYLKHYAINLKPYTAKGDHGRWFEAPCNIDLSNRFVVLELENLSNRPQLMEVIVMMLITLIANLMYRGESRRDRIMCVIDEAWALFKDDRFSQFITEGYRRARKYNGSFISGTQSLMDFNHSASTKALITNADTLVYLGSDLEDVNSAVKADLIRSPSDYGKHFIQQGATKKGHYSKVFIQSKGLSERMGRLVLDPFSKVLYSTDARIFNAIREKVDNGLSWLDAVRQVMSQQGL